jgi:hypothetical protein
VDKIGKQTELEIALHQCLQHRRFANRPSLDRHHPQFPSRRPFRALAEVNPSGIDRQTGEEVPL